ncbi:hypothetical protein RIR_jg8332.t1 [Rhizophagus irregularis DAOM 181602=DAOM 197198]|nr:hypothetical protein RIR_jg8332.t1 [Rhizophagus irregularis DAOM 181602=DAOM 197198]
MSDFSKENIKNLDRFVIKLNDYKNYLGKRHTLLCSHDLPNCHGQSYLQTSGASSSSIDTLANIRKTTIPKQKYKVAGPNALWHIDGNRYYQLFGTIIKSYSQNECQRTIYSPQYIGIIIVGTPTLIGIGIFFLAMSFKKDFINTFPWIKYRHRVLNCFIIKILNK